MQLGNDPKHRAHTVTKRLDEKGVERFKRPSFSPDLNPIEQIWDEIERRLKNAKTKNKVELRQALFRIWYNIYSNITKKLINSVPNRLNEVTRRDGYPTRY